MSSPKVSVVILNFNRPKLTKRLLKSLRRTRYDNFEIIVVENGSWDDSLQQLKEESGIHLVPVTPNRGFVGGCNVGVRYAKGKYIVLLNNDTIVDPNWMKELVDVMESDESIGLASALVKQKDGQGKYNEPRPGIPTLSSFNTWSARKSYGKEPYKQFSVGGTAFMYRKKDIQQPFPGIYFAYHEDTHLSWRMKLLGKKNVVVPTAIVEHEVGATTKKGKKLEPRYYMYAERNRVLNQLIFFQFTTLIRVLPHILLTILILNLYMPGQLYQHLKAYGWIITHPSWLISRRRRMQRQRHVKDSTYLPLLSGKLFEHRNVPPAISAAVQGLNIIMLAYLWIVRIPVAEHRRR